MLFHFFIFLLLISIFGWVLISTSSNLSIFIRLVLFLFRIVLFHLTIFLLLLFDFFLCLIRSKLSIHLLSLVISNIFISKFFILILR